MSEKFGIISSLEPLTVGESFEQWPLHVTVMTWFSLPDNRLIPFENGMRNLMHDFAPMELEGGEDAMFGPDRTVPVRILRKIGAFTALHNAIYDTVQRYGGVTESDYVGEDFVPHVTYQAGNGIAEGESVHLSGLHLISGDIEGPRVVRGQFRFMKGQPKHG